MFNFKRNTNFIGEVTAMLIYKETLTYLWKHVNDYSGKLYMLH